MPTPLDTIESIGNNREYLAGLTDQLRDGPGVTPFVGAGMSAQLNLLDWGNFLKSIGRRFGTEKEVRRLVDEAGLYEEAAERCIEAGGVGGLQHAITEEFGDKKLDQSWSESRALRLIAELTKGPVITTNFDHVLERAFRKARKEFRHVRWGPPASAVIEAFQRNHRELFKIHGDVDSPEDRILTRAEYNRHYGEPGAQQNEFPLHRVIYHALSNRPVLFLGCSLKSDRIIGFLSEFYAESQRLAHYAIVWRPQDDEEFNKRVKDLVQLGLRPIWYPFGQHDSIATILEHVLVGAGRKELKSKSIVSPAGPTAAQEAAVREKYDELAALDAAPPSQDVDGFDATAIARGELVLFLGWGAHFTRERQPGSPPNWREVAGGLARKTGYDEDINTVADFTRLTQFVYESLGEIQLEEHMRDVLGRPYPPTLAHWFVAGLPSLLRSKSYVGVAPLILTANQDDVLERAFAEAGEPLDTLSYIARGPDQGRFFYRPALGMPLMLRSAKQVAQVAVGERTLLVKLHGGIDRRNPEAEKMVLTEDDYLSYLAQASASEVLPPAVKQRLIRSSILFIGYSLADWTVRVLLKQIWAKQRPRKVSCAILLRPRQVTKTLLEKQGVRVIDDSWENVLAGFVKSLRALPDGPARTG